MKQTPAHDGFNGRILSILPKELKSVVEIGCMRGSLAREYLKDNPECQWFGIDIDQGNLDVAQEVCHQVLCANIEELSDDELKALSPADVWIFGDVLEHLRDPWLMMKRFRKVMSEDEAIITCIPNSQCWYFQARVNAGLVQYEDVGLFDRSHLRIFSRNTIIQMFNSTGFRVEAIYPLINTSLSGADKYMPHIRAMATVSGFDPDQAEQDAMAWQYVIRAVPI